MNPIHHYIVMFCIMCLSGCLTTMNVWADKFSDMRWSINDIYMTLLMTGWMFLFMGLYDHDGLGVLFGACLIVGNIWCIRTQYMVTDNQYILGMIPHHSMAVHMSRQLAKNPSTKIKDFVSSIIRTQEQEIDYMKNLKT